MKKSFGQHLLTDKNYLRKIIGPIDLKPQDTVLEIGSGTGLLTIELAKIAQKVYAVEIEKTILKKLKENIKINKLDNVEIIELDFLKLDLSSLTHNLSPLKIVGNIPYNITSKILLKLFGEIDNPASHLNLLKKAFLMLQYEVANRIVAKPNTKAYSPLTLLVQYFSKPEILFKVPATAFYPVPKVDSAFVVFNIKDKLPQARNQTLLKNIIRIAFQQRRKKLINSLSKLIEDKNLIIKTFDKLNLDHNLRAENLNFENYLALANSIKYQ